MADNKKKFTEPEIKAVEIEQADIICMSGGYIEGNVRFNGGSDYTFDEVDF